MGLYDTVTVPCPQCGTPEDFDHEVAALSVEELRGAYRKLREHRLREQHRDVVDGSPASIHELKAMLTRTMSCVAALMPMLDELAQLRARERLHANWQQPDDVDDLPPDAPTGLYLDRPFDIDDLGWLRSCSGSGSRPDSGGPPRLVQLMLVFKAIQDDARATREFLRAMNTNILPLLRRLRLQRHPELAKLGASRE